MDDHTIFNTGLITGWSVYRLYQQFCFSYKEADARGLIQLFAHRNRPVAVQRKSPLSPVSNTLSLEEFGLPSHRALGFIIQLK